MYKHGWMSQKGGHGGGKAGWLEVAGRRVVCLFHGSRGGGWWWWLVRRWQVSVRGGVVLVVCRWCLSLVFVIGVDGVQVSAPNS
jgi:hypothetical protein